MPGFLSRRAGHGERVASPYVELDRSQCEACWRCVEVCPESVMGKVEFWRHRHAVIADGGRCTGCLRCVKACQAGALTERAPLATSPSER